MIKILVKENNKLIKKIKFLDKFLVNERAFHFYDNVKSQSFFINSSRETHDKRLDKTHEIFSKYISNNQKNEILDIGVSDGSTAVNLYDFLLKKGFLFNLTISEIILEINQDNQKFISIFSDENLTIFKFSILNLIFDKNLSIYKYPISKIFFFIFLPTISILNDAKNKIEVFNKDTNNLLLKKKINQKKINVFKIKDIGKRYDFIRLFNILNHNNYKKKINKILTQLRKILNKDAVIICGYHFNKKICIFVYKNQIDGITLIEKNEFS